MGSWGVFSERMFWPCRGEEVEEKVEFELEFENGNDIIMLR
jgi:hypothetical protein